MTDKHGTPITGLTENDFRLLDNGKPQKLASFEEHRQQAPQLTEVSARPDRFSNDSLRHPPAQVNALLFDTTTIGIVDQMYLFQQMKQFVNNLPAGERVAVFTRAGSITLELLVSRKALKFTLNTDEQKARNQPNARLGFAHSVNLPDGSHYLYLGVWDMTTGRIGTMNAAVDVKKPTG